jgi:hypothetical protein
MTAPHEPALHFLWHPGSHETIAGVWTGPLAVYLRALPQLAAGRSRVPRRRGVAEGKWREGLDAASVNAVA